MKIDNNIVMTKSQPKDPMACTNGIDMTQKYKCGRFSLETKKKELIDWSKIH
jgi:hypothetical protein